MRLRDTATILRATAAVAVYAGETGDLDWTAPAETVVSCAIQPGTSVERNQDRETVVAQFIGFFYPGTDLTHTDRVSWRGLMLTVDGEVGPWVHNANLHHLEVPLKLVG